MPSLVTGLRVRVVRLLGGGGSADDWGRLFLYAREHTGGSEPVKEVGDFYAHRAERDRGLVVKRTRDFLTVAMFKIQTLHSGPLNITRIPAICREVWEINVDRTSAADFKRFGLRKQEVQKDKWAALLRKLVPNPDGTFRLATPYVLEELSLIDCLNSHINWAVTFTDEELVRDLKNILVRRAVLRQAEVKQFKTLSPFLAKFAITVMHGSAVRLANNELAQLSLTPSADGNLDIVAMSPKFEYTLEDGSRVMRQIGSPIIRTKLPILQHCDAGLLATPDWRNVDELEILNDGRLGVLAYTCQPNP